MAFDITLYTIQKRNNSTKQPSGSSKTLTGVLRDSCDVINPIIGFSFAGPYNQQLGRPVPMTSEFNPTDYNYAIIEEFKRSYFIESWEWNGGLWWAHMSVDVLGTYKQQIENHEFYITRSTAKYDPNIIDTKYIAKINTSSNTTGSTKLTDSTFVKTFHEGTIVFQILGYNGSSYRFCSGSEWSSILSSLYPISQETLPEMLSKALSEALVGGTDTIIQNILSVMWLPLDEDFVRSQAGLGRDVGLYLGQFDTGNRTNAIRNQIILTEPKIYTFIKRSTFKPNIGIRGQWENIEPFAEYSIYLPPFGNMILDSHKLVEHNYTISYNFEINVVNGSMAVKLYYGDSNEDKILHGVYTTNIGVMLKTGGQNVDAMSLIGGLAKSVGSALVAPELAPITTVASIASSIDQANKVISTGSSSNSLSPTLYDDIELKSTFYDPIEENNEEWGRPLCKRQTPSATGNGYILCADGDIDIEGATKSELSSIKSMLESGWFYE